MISGSKQQDGLVICLLMVSAVSLTLGILWSADGKSFFQIYGISILCWTGYIFAHKVSTGEFADSKSSGKLSVPDNLPERLIALTGLFMMIAAFPTGILGVCTLSFPITFACVNLFIWGYVIAHYDITGKPL